MAKAYASPVPYEFPQSFAIGVFEQHIQEYIDRVREELYRLGYNCAETGRVIRFPIADGYAQYMVATMKPLVLIHLPIEDAWQIPEAHMRGLTVEDVREEIAYAERLDSIFGRKE